MDRSSGIGLLLCRSACLAALFLAPWPAHAQGPDCATLEPRVAARGAEVRVTLTTPGTAKAAKLRLVPEVRDARRRHTIPDASVENGEIRFTVPHTPLGDYVLAVTTDAGMECTLPLQVATPPTSQLRLFEFRPGGTYDTEPVLWAPGEAGQSSTGARRDSVDLTLRGSGFIKDLPSDNKILIDDKAVPVDWTRTWTSGGCPPAPSQVRAVLGQVVSDQHIDLCDVPVNGSLVRVAVMQHGVAPTPPFPFRIYRWTTVGGAVVAGLTALLLALLVLWLVHQYKKSQTQPSQYNVLKILFLDLETDTYSLAKFQFYLWTAAGVFGYLYLVIAHLLVQGLGWPEMPASVPGIIAIGAGTAVGAQFVTNVRGPKGSGTQQPSLGDLVMSGGVAAADRVQMLVWTIVGVGIFCAATLRHAPGEIETLDEVPDSLMSLMGLSAIGYLGGKLARKSGPVINEISITPSEPDDALAGSATAPPGIPPNLSDAVAKARAELESLTGATTQFARMAVEKLHQAVKLAAEVKTLTQAEALATTLTATRGEAEQAAVGAANEFSLPGAPADAAAQAEIAQRAAAALDDLAAAVDSALGQRRNRAPGAPAFTRIIELRGRSLSAHGLFEIDGMELPFRMLTPDPDDPKAQRKPVVVIREPDSVDMAIVLRLSIDPSQLEAPDLERYKQWFGTAGRHTLRLISIDGQQDDLTFDIPPASAQSAVKTGQATAPANSGGTP